MQESKIDQEMTLTYIYSNDYTEEFRKLSCGILLYILFTNNDEIDSIGLKILNLN